MLIKRQFHLAFGAVVAALLAALTTFLIMHNSLQRMEELRTWANEVVKTAFDCNVLGSESMLQANERAHHQYRISSGRLQALLQDPPAVANVTAMIEQIRAHKKRLDILQRDYESKPPQSGSVYSREEAELQTMLVTQWMLQTRALIDSTQNLRSFASEETSRLRRLSLWIDVTALGLVALVTGWIFWKSYRTLVTPLELFSEGARRVGAGDLAHRLPIPHQNEIGVAAESFNRMTEQLSARQGEVDEKMRDLEAFCYSVAHDLKAPLRSVVGFGGLLESEFKEQLGPEGRSYIERMRAGSLRMSALIDDLLEFGQLTHRKVEIDDVNLKNICGELVAEMQPEISSARATVHCLNKNVFVRGNDFLLKQAIRNLLGNALKFSRPGAPPVIFMRAYEEPGWVVYEVEDNGIGIAKEHQQKVFGLFQRLHDHREYPGTGIGLAIVQKSIERLGGRIGVKSEPGKGSTFWLRLQRPH